MTRQQALEFCKTIELLRKVNPFFKLDQDWEEKLPIIKAFGEGEGIRIATSSGNVLYNHPDNHIMFDLKASHYTIQHKPKRIYVNLWANEPHAGYNTKEEAERAAVGRSKPGVAVEFIEVINKV